MTTEEKLAIAVETLKNLAKKAEKKMPGFLEKEDTDVYSWSGGNFDDAYELGMGIADWYSAKDAREALEKIGEL